MSIIKVLACGVLTFSLLSVPATATAKVPDRRQPESTHHQVTLITGDVVTFSRTGDRPTFTVRPAHRPDGQPVTFAGEQHGDDVYVIPSDVRQRVRERTVDRQLFNLTKLTGGLEVIVVFRNAKTGLAATTDSLPATSKVRALPVIGGAAARVAASGASAFWSALDGAGVQSVWLDEKLKVSLDKSVPRIGAPAAWQRGLTGAGVKVAVLDTGVDTEHPELAGKVTEVRDFTTSGSMLDQHGHGTHVAATIAGSGSLTGVAPGARLLSGKVCDDEGFCPESAILAGMDWAARAGARVVNLSLGGAPTDGTDPLSQAVDRLTLSTGALFVVAAGNFGCPRCVSAPAAARSALAVGAVDAADNLASFSSRGPRLGDAAVKPEILAPGVAITAARAAGTGLGTPVDELHTTASGTSMATPHVAGAAALLAQAHPAWQAIQLKNRLVGTAKDTGARTDEQGTGRVDIDRAVRGVVDGPATVDFGRITTTTTRVVTYQNRGRAPVTLRIELKLTDYLGRPADAAGNLSATTLVVPAGGVAASLLRIQPHLAAQGIHTGVVTARTADGAGAFRTAVSYYRPTAMAKVTVRMLDFAGAPVPGRRWAQVGAAQSNSNDPFNDEPYYGVELVDGVGTVDVPPGSYTAFAPFLDKDANRGAWLAASNVTVAGSQTIILDARKTVPSRAVTPEPAEVMDHQMMLSFDTPRSSFVTAIGGRDLQLSATPTAAVGGPAALVLQDHFTLRQNGALYNLSYSVADGIPATLTHDAAPARLVPVRTKYHADRSGLTVSRAWWGFRRNASGIVNQPMVVLPAPAEVVEYVNRDEEVLWTRYAALDSAQGDRYGMYNRGAFPATEDWFSGPVVPTLPGFLRVAADGGDVFRPSGMVSDSGPDHRLDVDTTGYPFTWRLSRDGVQLPGIPVQGSKVPAFRMPDAAGTYELEATMVLPATWARGPSLAIQATSPRVDTRWSFRSAKAVGTCPPPAPTGICEPQSLLLPYYDLGLDLANRAPAGQDHELGITIGNGTNASGLKLDYSTDQGATWRAAQVTSSGNGRFTATVGNTGAAGEYVWLRAEAWDDSGNRVSQTVQRAYLLK